MNLKEAMKSKGIGQQRLAEILGCSRSLVAQWTSSYSTPAFKWLSPINEALGQEVDYPLKQTPIFIVVGDDSNSGLPVLITADSKIAKDATGDDSIKVYRVYLERPIDDYCEPLN